MSYQTHPFYSSGAWKRVRAQARARDANTCTRCGAVGVPIDVDHIIKWTERPDLALALDNRLSALKGGAFRLIAER